MSGADNEATAKRAQFHPDAHVVAAAGAADRITVLKSTTGLAGKRVYARAATAPEIQGYSAGSFFNILEVPVSGIADLSAALRVVESVPSALVIRGALKAGLDPTKQHRRRKENFQTPSVGRRWMLIDFDNIPMPPGLCLQQDVGAVCEHLITLLPTEFCEASYHWQLSSSAGLGDPTVVSMHLWFWLDRPLPDVELKGWAKWWNEQAGTKIIDTALFNDVQAHYTAAPEFTGMADPFPVRSGLTCKGVGEVALCLPPPKRVRVGGGSDRRGSIEPSGGFEAILAQIGDHPGGQGFHLPIIRAVASYVAQEGAGIDVEVLYEPVHVAVLAADHSNHDDEYVEWMASREHIIPAITSAIDKFGNADSPRRKSRQIEGISPHFTSKPTPVATASCRLKTAIDEFFR